ncbi:MAG: hypothetical protein JKY84_11500 [Emcibacteraceae bacterium]|nr:hypothetical protein [Emcibacteraceae bacterium]
MSVGSAAALARVSKSLSKFFEFGPHELIIKIIVDIRSLLKITIPQKIFFPAP